MEEIVGCYNERLQWEKHRSDWGSYSKTRAAS